jgi:hypothetical protein
MVVDDSENLLLGCSRAHCSSAAQVYTVELAI